MLKYIRGENTVLSLASRIIHNQSDAKETVFDDESAPYMTLFGTSLINMRQILFSRCRGPIIDRKTQTA